MIKIDFSVEDLNNIWKERISELEAELVSTRLQVVKLSQALNRLQSGEILTTGPSVFEEEGKDNE